MSQKTQFYLLDVDSNAQGYAVVYGRTLKGDKITIYDNSTKPFFWVFSDSKKDAKKIELIETKEHEVLKTEIKKMSHLDKPVSAIKVTVGKNSDVQPIRKEIKKLKLKYAETDFSFKKRYLIEKQITPLQLCEVEIEDKEENKVKGIVRPVKETILPNPKILAFDIETTGHSSSSNPIVSIALYSQNKKQVISYKSSKKTSYLKKVEDEQELIEEFIKSVNQINPDYIIGYYSDVFDFPYLKKRAEKYKISLTFGGSQIKIRKSEHSIISKIDGIPHIDVLKFLRGIMGNSLNFDSYSLDFVANQLLSKGKEDFEREDIKEVWEKEKNLENLFKYNLKDAELTYEIFEKILPNLQELVRITNATPFETSRMTYGQLVENYLLNKAKELNEIAPNKPKFTILENRKNQTYEGAFVLQPTPGFYKNLAFFDFLSLYPTIIISKNISPGTLNKSKGSKVPEKSYYFSNTPQAFIPKVLKEILEQRKKIKIQLQKNKNDKILKARSYALKTIANSTYGYFGFFGSRWYSKECAESITAWARDYIKETIKKAEKEFGGVIYSDTDSICIELKDKPRIKAKEFLNKINKNLPDIMELELEDFYPRGIFVSKKGQSSESKGAKKKYALIDDEGKIKIIGFETVRRDWSPIARTLQKEVIESILKQGKIDNAFKHTKEVIQKILSKKADKKELILRTQLKMDLSQYKSLGPHVKIAQKMQKQGIPVTAGTSIAYIITSKKGIIRDKAELPEDAKDYDAEYYINHQIIPAVEKIFEIFSISKEQLKGMAKQSKLDEY